MPHPVRARQNKSTETLESTKRPSAARRVALNSSLPQYTTIKLIWKYARTCLSRMLLHKASEGGGAISGTETKGCLLPTEVGRMLDITQMDKIHNKEARCTGKVPGGQQGVLPASVRQRSAPYTAPLPAPCVGAGYVSIACIGCMGAEGLWFIGTT